MGGEMSAQLHAMAIFTQTKEFVVPTGWEAG
jgi:hypothetical protein